MSSLIMRGPFLPPRMTTLFLAFVFVGSTSLAAETNPERKLLTGRAAMGDSTSDAPGVRRRITVDDLPPPNETKSASNSPTVIKRPSGAQLNVPPGFKIEEYAQGFRNPRFLLTAPNGDIFVTESQANRITVLRDTNGDGKPDRNESFGEVGLNQPFGIAFIRPARSRITFMLQTPMESCAFPTRMATHTRAANRKN